MQSATGPAEAGGAEIQHPHRVRLRVLPLDRRGRLRRPGGAAVRRRRRADGAAELRVHACLSLRDADRRRTGRRTGNGSAHRSGVRRRRRIDRGRARRDARPAPAGATAPGRGRRDPRSVLPADLSTGFFLAQVYSEAFFLAAAFGALAFLADRRPLQAGLLAIVAVLTRPVGLALVFAIGVALALFVVKWRRGESSAPSSLEWVSWAFALVASGGGIYRLGDVGDGAGVRDRPARVLRARPPEPGDGLEGLD